MKARYDALLIVSFGGPEGMDDVMPFLKNVLRGRNVPDERIKEVAHHYELFGGVSPINGQIRDLITGLKRELTANGPDLPIYWGNRNWHPLLADTIRQMGKDRIESALAFVTSAYSSYSGCRQYLENIENARLEAGFESMRIDKIRAFFNHPLFIKANADNLRAAIAESKHSRPHNIPAAESNCAHPQDIPVAFTAHSIPASMAANCDYEIQLLETSRLIAEECGIENWALCYQSRSGSPAQKWLEPDILDHIRHIKDARLNQLAVAPVGFVSDHMEVIYDLDVEAKNLCQDLGVSLFRARTAGTHPDYIKMIRELILERLGENIEPRAVGQLGPRSDICPVECCRIMTGCPPLSGRSAKNEI